MKTKNIKFTLSDGKFSLYHFDTENVTDATIKRLCRTLNSQSTPEEELSTIEMISGLQKEYNPASEATLLFKCGDSSIVVMECVYRPESKTYVRGKVIDEIVL